MCNQCPAGVSLPAVMPNLGLIVEDFAILNREQYAEIARAVSTLHFYFLSALQKSHS
jgi:hypothetical protein